MIRFRFIQTRCLKPNNLILIPNNINTSVRAHTKLCPTNTASKCAGSSGLPKRGSPGKVRFGFIPDEWFTFFHPKTGVSGLYVLGIVGINYLISKEIYVMEHEYYSGLSIALMVICGVKKFGKNVGASLDKEVDATAKEWEKGRNDEIEFYNLTIKSAKDAQWRAEGQKLLMDAKKENILMQLEAAYRERYMHVYRSVKGRMDYHVKRYHSEARIHQRWMLGWILENVRNSITPDFQKEALNAAISDLAALAGRT